MMNGEWTADELSRILDAHGAALRLFAAQWSPSPEDCVQDALVKLISLRERPSRAVPWLYRVVRNRAVSQQRSWFRRKRRERNAASRTAAWFEPDLSADNDGRTAAEALAKLDDAERAIVVARIWGGLSFDEIAEVERISRSAAHRRYHEALDALRRMLDPASSFTDT